MALEKTKERRTPEILGSLVGERVLGALGEPTGLLRIQVKLLWENCYRVNVLIGGDAASARVANSYFVEADNDGNIVNATPKITRQY